MPFTTEQFLNVFADYNNAVWRVIGFFAALNFGIYEDTGLLASGVIAFALLIPGGLRKKV